MGPLTLGAVVFACVLGGASFGMYLGRVLPKHHLSDDAKDVIKVSMAMVATMAALVLGPDGRPLRRALLTTRKASSETRPPKSFCSIARWLYTEPRRVRARDLLRATGGRKSEPTLARGSDG